MIIKRYLFIYILLIYKDINGSTFRNPFSFSQLDHDRIRIRDIAKLDLNHQNFVVLRDRPRSEFNIIKSGQYLFGYKVIDILSDYLIIRDDECNEIIIIFD